MDQILPERSLLCRQGPPFLLRIDGEVALVERKAETGTLLHIVLPARINPERAIRITIDRHEPVSATISRCGRLCWADHAAGPELVEQLKQGQTLLLEAVNRDDTPHIVTIALAGFAEAYDGPPKPMPEFKLRIGSQVEMSAAREQQKRVEEERARRCGSSP